ncbi:Glutamate decarboxylase 2 [Bagarius yarrelli]|uniref:glutamate decarboxylase n=1 Tax=Bagarius yarrelli TaxID=175774 RepID=A0A556VV36_BAGYA|nr:Glutamate decarboxylase 2 [Bagarius yarrelli]
MASQGFWSLGTETGAENGGQSPITELGAKRRPRNSPEESDPNYVSHFSIKKGAAALGIGTESVICIKADERGKLIPSDLERRIVEAKQKVAPTIKARMMEYGTTMVSYQPQGDKVNFFRMVISNPAATFEDIDFLIEEIERLGQDL